MNRVELKRALPEEVGISSKVIYDFVQLLEKSKCKMHGLMIIKDKYVIAEGWWNPYAPGIRHGLQSLSKTYAATAVGIAYTKKLLLLDDKVISYFKNELPDNMQVFLNDMTIYDLLSMGCGMITMPEMGSQNYISEFFEQKNQV